ncbi:MAG: aspartate--ammonia ligase [Oscillospiraceae bacterium]|nr:aspartate--ammonia ligase [Oscillospiraceae bacterium]
MSLSLPKDYRSELDGRTTEKAIKFIKDTFQHEIVAALNLQRISAPLFVRPETGLNDNLNGVERPVSFDAPCIGGATLEIVHSLAKWKRMTLGRYGFEPGEGLYTDMNAIRRDEEVDNLHSMYVDQWDWEEVIEKKDRNTETLKKYVKNIYAAMKATQTRVCQKFPMLDNNFADEITFITTQELEDMYPELEPKERENKLLREKKAVFLMQIGKELKSGKKHDGRAPDYDDWELNGDILVYYPLLDIAYELSSMGIRVDEDSLVSQIKIAGCEERLKMDFHKKLANKELPYTIGGGIGQSRLCMYMLNKAHIGEVQASVWPEDMREECAANGINLL